MGKLVTKIKDVAKRYTDTHVKNPTNMDYLIIENAFLLGSALALEDVGEEVMREFSIDEKYFDLVNVVKNIKPGEIN